MASRHLIRARHSFDLKRIILTLFSFAPSYIYSSRWKSPKNEWRQQPWDIQTIPTIARLRDVSPFRPRPSR